MDTYNLGCTADADANHHFDADQDAYPDSQAFASYEGAYFNHCSYGRANSYNYSHEYCHTKSNVHSDTFSNT